MLTTLFTGAFSLEACSKVFYDSYIYSVYPHTKKNISQTGEIEHSRALAIKIQSFNGFAGHHTQPPLMIQFVEFRRVSLRAYKF